MGRVKQLAEDDRQAAMERYMEEHPDADPQDAEDATSDPYVDRDPS